MGTDPPYLLRNEGVGEAEPRPQLAKAQAIGVEDDEGAVHLVEFVVYDPLEAAYPLGIPVEDVPVEGVLRADVLELADDLPDLRVIGGGSCGAS